ncbi:anillin isoform X1 [Silurus meridionalis]|uniref:anillin isoform X1 n=1 Tax=Silurus meridionalis TaxID=175797 RepID=UPI001EEB9E5D|nr:anillin isoform X1 [Silurus meridionalis]XP_046691279.1 anillin isoform X1 [Silurus meridionalis]XP_046691280.1 anillin isoform X1 [Silurus meridionalis]
MDPFTEKLLERTRARRENLQKKMAERPTAANRQMNKRSREPLTETNSVLGQPPAEKALPSLKPSPSKRRCSEENAGEENKEPAAPQVTVSEPAIDKKPPIAPSSNQSATVERLAVQTSSDLVKGLPHHSPDTEKMEAYSSQITTGCTDKVIKHSIMAESSEAVRGAPALIPSAGNMRSRLQKLADQRHCWDSEGGLEPAPNSVALSPIKSQSMAIAPNPAPAITSEKPLGRKGRLANLAVTISSWEDDLGHPPTYRDNAQGQPGTACVPPPARVGTSTSVKTIAAAQQTKSVGCKPVHSTQQPAVYSPVRSSRVIPPSPQKTDVPETKQRHLSPASSPLKSFSSQQSSPVKAGRVPFTLQAAQTSKSPLKTQAPCKELGPGKVVHASPAKTNAAAHPSSGVVLSQAPERLIQNSTPIQKSGPVGPSGGVKSFLERFGERCQERNQGSPLNGVGVAHTPAATPSSPHKSKLLLERLPVTHGASTTALLTQKQKMEREAELAQVRNRFQNSKVSKSREDLSEDANNAESKEVDDPNLKSVPVLNKEPSAPRLDVLENKLIKNETSNINPVLSSPLKKVEVSSEKAETDKQETKEEIREIEMNVDSSINSEVINNLFEDVLEEKDEDASEEDEEEDALNISSMSLLTPLAETVASVVKSPERRVMTSTPASSFTEKNGTPEAVSRPTKFQRTRMLGAGSSDSIDTIDEEHKLPYSIDAYRSTRVKETERPQVKQVIVRKEDVSQKIEVPKNSSHISIKQKMQVLSNEMSLQQTVIHQASQALNCCTDEDHGKGSQVEAEAERLLLIATEKRVALKAELDQLKAEGPTVQKKSSSKAQDDMGVPPSKGSITLHDLRLPLKADFVCSSANRPESGSHYFFVMIRAGAENMVATPLASTSALNGDALTFSTKFTLPDVSSDFEIDIEVYYLVLKRELFAEKRKKPAKSKAITPKRFLGLTKSNLQTPVVASPGGPNAVRTSSFSLVGSHKLTLCTVGKNKFPLEKIKYEGCESRLLSDMFQNKVPFLCPLEGHIYLRMHCEVDSHVQERGFLTMFEDVSGFGAWHRRWCVLSGYCISYWTYPDDEKRKNPIGRINLASCTSRKVEPANREFCARPNTFELITVRPQRDNDRETLVSQCKNTMCVTKNWLSADTKDERNLWMRKLNQILVDLRMWQPDSCYRPV